MQVHHQATLLRTALISVLRQENIKQSLPATFVEQRQLLGDVLIASNTKWKEETLQLIDELYNSEARDKEVVSVNNVVHNSVLFHNDTRVSVWRGDITFLQVDAIVNAANEQGLGCFQPSHYCIDNVIHRQAGPRLRLACKDAMEARDAPLLLSAGTPPIVTRAFHLPCKQVIHVTGPQVLHGELVSEWHEEALASAYSKSLDVAAANDCKSIAFPCISTGLFGFPAKRAAEIALETVQTWLQEHPNQLEHVIFDVFTTNDTKLYQELMGHYFSQHSVQETTLSFRNQSIQLAKSWIENADAVLICAGAGMSVKEGEMVYTNPHDFARAYPWFTKWGYHTSYQVMGLEGDASVPRTAKWALYAKHMDNMRWKFTPNDGYEMLVNLVKKKDHFVLTSNVDACFERSGFDKERIYTPQGEWTYLQCQKPCRSDSVYESRPYLDNILPNISNDGLIPADLVPKCKRCGSKMFGNVRAGSNFLHHHYQGQNDKLRGWMQSSVESNAKVVVIEVGAGFNTPTVTRFPVESFARELGDRAKLVRINPTEAQVPDDLNAIALEEGWQVLGDIVESDTMPEAQLGLAEQQVKEAMSKESLLVDSHVSMQYAHYFGHFDWRRFLLQLKDH